MSYVQLFSNSHEKADGSQRGVVSDMDHHLLRVLIVPADKRNVFVTRNIVTMAQNTDTFKHWIPHLSPLTMHWELRGPTYCK